jgi:AcrR family transcriptional regulator
MPRGTAIPDLAPTLFAATQRLLDRDGPMALSSRNITEEAGVAKGVLHNHFVDLDAFLAQFVIAAFHAAHQLADRLPAKAGQGTVRENLAQTATALLDSHVAAAHGLLLSRPSLTKRFGNHDGHHKPGLLNLERSFTRYLDAEKKLGRVSADADAEAIALALVATVHRLVIGAAATMEPRMALSRVIDVLNVTGSDH